MAEFKQYLGDASGSSNAQQPKPAAPPGPQHSVHLSWNASTSAVAGYNVYRRGPSGLTRINSERAIKTSYIDNSVQPGQTYYYVIKAVNSAGTESVPSNEVQAVVPSP
jgi:fibronectin type 3 domain-containing protein